MTTARNTIQLTIHGRPFVLTALTVRRGMRDFNTKVRLKGRDSGSRYAIFDAEGMPYPPKAILSLCTGCLPNEFSGGNRVNTAFKSLGFEVKRAPRAIRLGERWPRELPAIKVLVSRLFSQKWAKFDQQLVKRFSRRFDAKYPGVYMFAYPSAHSALHGKRVNEADVYYVGMSNYAGLGPRLRQFWDGTQRGGKHSGANRFFLREGPYKAGAKPLYVVWFAVPCTTSKNGRSARDLETMGAVAYLELAAMARIRSKCEAEPSLNKK